jgi:hypothetical protein
MPPPDLPTKHPVDLMLVGVGHHVVTERQARSEQHDGHGTVRLAEGQAAHDDGQRHNNEYVFALEPVGDHQTQQWPDRRGQCDQRGIEQAIGPVVIRKGLELDRIMLIRSDLFPSWNYRHGDYY